jgi:hypothetical protein
MIGGIEGQKVRRGRMTPFTFALDTHTCFIKTDYGRCDNLFLDDFFNGSQDIIELLVDVDKRALAQVMVIEIREYLAQAIKRHELILAEVGGNGSQT